MTLEQHIRDQYLADADWQTDAQTTLIGNALVDVARAYDALQAELERIAERLEAVSCR